MSIYIGYDKREDAAYRVAVASLLHHSPLQRVTPLDAEVLSAGGLLSRPIDRRGQSYDLVSGAPQSTDFATSRFLTPLLAQTGWALFVDCDVVFCRPVENLFTRADNRYAVMVVKHQQLGGGIKMDGQEQTSYPRKNWSSVCLWNCDHAANKRLSLWDINNRPGRDLHAFYWLHDDEIGELPGQWNWLVGVQDKPAEPGIAHFTLGGPWLQNWPKSEHDDIWMQWCQNPQNEAQNGAS